MIHTTLKIFHKIAVKHKLSSTPSPLSSLANNPDFPPGLDNKNLFKDSTNKPLLAYHCLQNNKLKSYTDVQHKIGTKPLNFNFWIYLQIHNFILNNKKKNYIVRPLTNFELICLNQTPIKKITSFMYNWLSQPTSDLWDKYKRIVGGQSKHAILRSTMGKSQCVYP